MALERRSATKTVFLQVKHYCLWQELKKKVDGCESIEVVNPKTGVTLIKHGYAYDRIKARVTKIVKYDTEKKYATRYFGFKMHMEDGSNQYVLDMPYQSQMLRRFLRVMPNIDWHLPLSIAAFKGKKQDGGEELGIWFQQSGATVKPYFTREQPHGMPEAVQDQFTKDWDFKPQLAWLVQYLFQVILPQVEIAAARLAPPLEPMPENVAAGHEGDEPEPDVDPYGGQGITDDDVPF
jgi:hypothetical protein